MADETPSGINQSTVETLFEDVREHLKFEDAREQSINTRAGGLAGFVGIVVAITTGLGKLALDLDPSRLAAVLAGFAFGVTMLALMAALGIAIVKVLLPQESSAISMKRIESYPTWAYISRDQVMAQGEIMRGWINALARDRQRNSLKAKWLRRAYIAFLVGMARLVLLAVILGVDEA